MIFDVAPSQIEDLDNVQLVQLLRKLLYAEAWRTGISLRSVSVPLQINVPDGGEDARISWAGGHENTDYLPSRFCIFQSKATKLGPADWEKEVWTKASRKKDAKRILNKAVKKSISEHGSYIGFTSAALVGDKIDILVEAIRRGIRETGADPSQLKTIDIYDANKIAEWASRNPAVAVWLNERITGLALRGFETIEGWGKRAEINSLQHVDDTKPRYKIGNKESVDQRGDESLQNLLKFQQAKARISDHLAEPTNSVRLIGPSGIGKTRFAFEIFKDAHSPLTTSSSTSAIYCDYRNVSHQIIDLVHSIAVAGSPTLLIVDECSREAAIRLDDIVTIEGSELRLLTINFDDRIIERDGCLNVSVAPSDTTLIDGIVRQRFPDADDSEITYINNLCGGYPRIAVLATGNYLEKASILKSIDDVVERIFVGCGINQIDQIRAIECLALFDRLGADEELSKQIDFVSEKLGRQTGDEMYEHLARASQHHLVDRRGRYFVAQPLPIAAFLGARRLDLLRVQTLLQFIEDAPESLLISFFKQWRYFDVSRTAVAVAEKLLAHDGQFGSLESLNTEHDSECLDALVHVNPDAAADALHRVFGALSIDELKEVKDARRNLVWALEKLVFRQGTFRIAARLLMRFSAAEIEGFDNNATGLFKQLFQLYPSGTEAAPADRFVVLDEGLLSDDERLVSVCVEALENTLDQGYSFRSGGSEQIGSRPPLKDWRPNIRREIFEFHRGGLDRLVRVQAERPQFAARSEQIIVSHVRGILMNMDLFEDVEGVIKKIARKKGLWLEAIEGVGDWLYFDRTGAPGDYAQKVRDLYNQLMPTELIQKAFLYTKFWSADIRDPDWIYDKSEGSKHDFEYSSKMAKEIASEIALNEELTYKAIKAMTKEELHNAFPFAQELAFKVKDPVKAFKTAIAAIEGSASYRGIQFIRGMLSGIDKRDSEAANECMQFALASEALKDQSMNIYTAVKITTERLADAVTALKNGTLVAADCVALSYGRGLDDLDVREISPLIDELTSAQGAEGIWTALEIISMYQHGRAELDDQLATKIKQQVTSPSLLGKVRRATRDGWLFENLILSVQKHFGLDEEFASDLSKQIIRLCQVEDHDVFLALDDPARKIIRLLVQEKPIPLWETLSRFYEISTPVESRRLENLIGPPRHGFDGEGHNKEGVLFGIPIAYCVGWAKDDPPNRAPFLCLFYPILEAREAGDQTWHTAIEILTNEFGAVKEFRDALSRRLFPGSWSGSLIPHLEVYLRPLEKWFGHPIPEMISWAREEHRRFEKWIARERRDEDEDPHF